MMTSRSKALEGNYLFCVLSMLALAVAVASMATMTPVPAQAATTAITVDTASDEASSTDDGKCSLREAIQAANTNQAVDSCRAGSSTEVDRVFFALGSSATITLGSQLPTVTDSAGLRVNGRRASITVSGDDKVRVFEVAQDAKLNLNHLTVANGRSAFDDRNIGGGILNEGGDLRVLYSIISNNTARDGGGGIFSRGALLVRKSTFLGNNAGSGGGIGAASSPTNPGKLRVVKSTFSKNIASSGGGAIISNVELARVTNSTFSDNSATSFRGGAIESYDDALAITNSTFSGNRAPVAGSSISSYYGGATTLRNTVVANSTSVGNCEGVIDDGGYNIEDGTSCGFDGANNSLSDTDPKLAPSLANNGGPTNTIALLEGSPAIDLIPDTTSLCGTLVAIDQRGVMRPQGAGCDVGAFEMEQQ